MLKYALRSLFHDRLRFSMAVIGIGVAVAVILVIRGFQNGVYEQAMAYPARSGADLFVGAKGFETLAFGRSFIPAAVEAEISAALPSAQVAGLLVVGAMFSPQGITPIPVVVYGYDTQSGLGGPWALSEGRLPQKDKEAVLDRVLARRVSVEPGDEVELLGNRFKVTGLSKETNSWMTPSVFIPRDTLASAMAVTGAYSVVSVRLPDGVDRASAASALEREIENVAVLLSDDLARNERRSVAEVMDASLRLMLAIAVLVGTMMVGLAIYTFVGEQVAEHGLLKAMGATTRHLFHCVLTQGFVAVTAGYVVGTGLSYGFAAVMDRLAPELWIKIPFEQIPAAYGVLLLMGLVGAVIPLARVVGVDPCIAFKRVS